MSEESEIKGPVTIPLKVPIQAHGEEVSSLTLRRPTGKDIRICGFIADANGEINTQAIHNYIVQLGGIPGSSVDRLDAEDFMSAMVAVCGFLGGFPGTSSM